MKAGYVLPLIAIAGAGLLAHGIYKQVKTPKGATANDITKGEIVLGVVVLFIGGGMLLSK